VGSGKSPRSVAWTAPCLEPDNRLTLLTRERIISAAQVPKARRWLVLPDPLAIPALPERKAVADKQVRKA